MSDDTRCPRCFTRWTYNTGPTGYGTPLRWCSTCQDYRGNVLTEAAAETPKRGREGDAE